MISAKPALDRQPSHLTGAHRAQQPTLDSNHWKTVRVSFPNFERSAGRASTATMTMASIPRPRIPLCFVLTLAACWLGPFSASADDSQSGQPDAIEHFEKHIRPLFIRECQRCHGAEKQQGNLRLDTANGWRVGGDSGPAIEPGDPEASLLFEALLYDDGFEMPPRGKLAASEIAHVRKWIEMGASDPRDESTMQLADNRSIVEKGRQFWSFQPIDSPAVPSVDDGGWCKSDIDRFIFRRLGETQLEPGPDANRTTLVRRLYFDLIGLPPTPQQIDSFLSDARDDAVERLVDELLASPHFGERWGRHWLDVVRFAESSGGGRSLVFPNAWRYRDYVIESFNSDRPFNQFVTEQIAGDLLNSDDWAERRQQLVATGFLLLGPTNYELQDKDILELDVVDEQLDTIGKSLMGMTIGCARCHDHKFDPIPTQDYYAMAGILKSTKAMIHSNVSKWNTYELPLPPDLEMKRREQDARLAALKAELAAAKKLFVDAGGEVDSTPAGPKSIDVRTLPGRVVDNAQAELVGEWTLSTSNAQFVGADYAHDSSAANGQKSATYRFPVTRNGNYEVRLFWSPGTNRATRVPVTISHGATTTSVTINQRERPAAEGEGRSMGTFDLRSDDGELVVVIRNEKTNDGVVVADAVQLIELSATSQGEPDVVSQRDAESQAREEKLLALKGDVDRLEAEIDGFEKTLVARPLAMVAGDDDDAGDIPLAIRGVASERGPIVPRGVLRVVDCDPFGEIPDKQSGRRELAEWLVDPQHPLTSRVYVNRVWHWLIGRGLVATVDNFGTMGQEPTHPELLDHLADTFMNDGWSTKRLIRRIVLSRTYQLSSMKPSGRSLEVDPDNRLLPRSNRKRMRAEDVRDTLLVVGGNLDTRAGGPGIKPGTGSEYGYQFKSVRRSVYVPVFRNTLHELFEVFDFADPNIQQGRRSKSTVSSQALLMMNHPFVREQAIAAAERLTTGPIQNTNDRIDTAWKQVLGRYPTDDERAIAITFLTDASQNEQSGLNERERWSMLYHGLFQTIDFRFVH